MLTRGSTRTQEVLLRGVLYWLGEELSLPNGLVLALQTNARTILAFYRLLGALH